MKKISSLLFVLLLMLASFTAGTQYPRGDVDLDGMVGIADVTCLIDYLLSGTWDDEPAPPGEHEWVDLGLSSGTLWATCNVGANSPEEYGDYFAWGETSPKSIYDWSTYKWCISDSKMTKYCSTPNYGTVDNLFQLELEDDAAYVNWGSSWRTPTRYQAEELATQCSWKGYAVNGIGGWLGTGPNGNTLFLPAAGYFSSNSHIYPGSHGMYWSSTVGNAAPQSYRLWLYYINVECANRSNRCLGCTVRPVRVLHN